MAYDLHVVRSVRWADSANLPITKSEVDALVEADPELAWSKSDFIQMKDETGVPSSRTRRTRTSGELIERARQPGSSDLRPDFIRARTPKEIWRA